MCYFKAQDFHQCYILATNRQGMQNRIDRYVTTF